MGDHPHREKGCQARKPGEGVWWKHIAKAQARGQNATPDCFLAVSRVLELLGGDLVHEVTQPLLDDVEGDLLGVATSAAGPLDRSCGLPVEGHNVLQHIHRLHPAHGNDSTLYMRQHPPACLTTAISQWQWWLADGRGRSIFQHVHRLHSRHNDTHTRGNNPQSAWIMSFAQVLQCAVPGFPQQSYHAQPSASVNDAFAQTWGA